MTLKEIAKHSGFCAATVSGALRNDPKFPLKTRQRVQAVAQKLGYRPNPRIASLMAHIRRGRGLPMGERIAYVWVRTTRDEARKSAFLQSALNGAKMRAEQAGYLLEEFWTEDPGMTSGRLQRIIQARGIVGVVLSPVVNSNTTMSLDWDWEKFAPAVIGTMTWTPELHHAAHHHYLGMRTCVTELVRLGARRPAALIDAPTHERVKRAWEGAFLTHHPDAAKARGLFGLHDLEKPMDSAAWLEASRADALIVSSSSLLDLAGLRTMTKSRRLPVASLHWHEEDAAEGIGGVDQCYPRIAGHAVDLVISQLNLNELGAPDLPRTMMFNGIWRLPRVARGRSVKARKT